jgi:hypothetical protein
MRALDRYACRLKTRPKITTEVKRCAMTGEGGSVARISPSPVVAPSAAGMVGSRIDASQHTILANIRRQPKCDSARVIIPTPGIVVTKRTRAEEGRRDLTPFLIAIPPIVHHDSNAERMCFATQYPTLEVVLPTPEVVLNVSEVIQTFVDETDVAVTSFPNINVAVDARVQTPPSSCSAVRQISGVENTLFAPVHTPLPIEPVAAANQVSEHSFVTRIPVAISTPGGTTLLTIPSEVRTHSGAMRAHITTSPPPPDMRMSPPHPDTRTSIVKAIPTADAVDDMILTADVVSPATSSHQMISFHPDVVNRMSMSCPDVETPDVETPDVETSDVETSVALCLGVGNPAPLSPYIAPPVTISLRAQTNVNVDPMSITILKSEVMEAGDPITRETGNTNVFSSRTNILSGHTNVLSSQVALRFGDTVRETPACFKVEALVSLSEEEKRLSPSSSTPCVSISTATALGARRGSGDASARIVTQTSEPTSFDVSTQTVGISLPASSSPFGEMTRAIKTSTFDKTISLDEIARKVDVALTQSTEKCRLALSCTDIATLFTRGYISSIVTSGSRQKEPTLHHQRSRVTDTRIVSVDEVSLRLSGQMKRAERKNGRREEEGGGNEEMKVEEKDGWNGSLRSAPAPVQKYQNVGDGKCDGGKCDDRKCDGGNDILRISSTPAREMCSEQETKANENRCTDNGWSALTRDRSVTTTLDVGLQIIPPTERETCVTMTMVAANGDENGFDDKVASYQTEGATEVCRASGQEEDQYESVTEVRCNAVDGVTVSIARPFVFLVGDVRISNWRVASTPAPILVPGPAPQTVCVDTSHVDISNMYYEADAGIIRIRSSGLYDIAASFRYDVNARSSCRQLPNTLALTVFYNIRHLVACCVTPLLREIIQTRPVCIESHRLYMAAGDCLDVRISATHSLDFVTLAADDCWVRIGKVATTSSSASFSHI